MSQALDAVDRPILYQICQWGVGTDLGVWAPKWGNSWRISNDIYNSWSSIWRITNQVVPFWKHTGVGKYADMDMLVCVLFHQPQKPDIRSLKSAASASTSSALKKSASTSPCGPSTNRP